MKLLKFIIFSILRNWTYKSRIMDTLINKKVEVPPVLAKDECLYCFETCVNSCKTTEKGEEQAIHKLLICLDCFQALCPRHLSLHRDVALNVQGHTHDYFMELFKCEKESTKAHTETQSNKKLKLQVLEKSDNELFDTLWSVLHFDPNKNVLCDSSTTSTDTTPSFITQILNSKSQTLQDQTNSWELQINSCQHTKDFQTSSLADNSNIDVSHCSDCLLTNNLWLCLHCGNIGCGREQIGIEGNSHALNHFSNNPEHPLAIKLGSLSLQSNDIYCYKCNDEVKFTTTSVLHDILQKFNINLNDWNTTEKTLTELQVEQNMNWEFNMKDSQGNELNLLEPSKGTGLGLINLGNSCYMNSVFQSLFHNKNWCSQLVTNIGNSLEFPLDVLFPTNNFNCQWVKLYNAIKIEPELYPNGIKPQSIKRCIANAYKNDEFLSERQQDAMEYLTFLVATMDKKFSNETMSQIFKFNVMNKLKCTTCGYVKYIEELSESIQIPLPEKVEKLNLMEQLSNLFNQDDNIEFKCTNCHKVENGKKQISLLTGPEVLVLNPMRIVIDKSTWTPVKTSQDISFDHKINLKNFIFDKDDHEDIMPDDDDDGDNQNNEFKPNSNALNQLMEMGFSENASEKALYNTGNMDDAENAMQWLFEHVEDSDINEPLSIVNEKKSVSNEPHVNEEALQNMISMGLSLKLSKKALFLNDGDVNKSVEWVFNNMDDNGEIEISTTESDNNNSESSKIVKKYGTDLNIGEIEYELQSIVCHKGTSTQSGHYVTFVKNPIGNNGDWFLFNDEKIVEIKDEEEIRKNGYIFIYKKL